MGVEVLMETRGPELLLNMLCNVNFGFFFLSRFITTRDLNLDSGLCCTLQDLWAIIRRCAKIDKYTSRMAQYWKYSAVIWSPRGV